MIQLNKLTAFFSSISEAGNENSTLEKIKQTFVVLIESITPYSKTKSSGRNSKVFNHTIIRSI